MSGETLIERGRRYTLVGIVCAAAHNLIVIGADAAGLHYLPATLLSFMLVTPLGYGLHSRYTFRRPLSTAGLLRFTSGVAIGYPISVAFMILFCSGLGLPVVVAAPLATAALFVWNYLSAQWAILRTLRLR